MNKFGMVITGEEKLVSRWSATPHPNGGMATTSSEFLGFPACMHTVWGTEFCIEIKLRIRKTYMVNHECQHAVRLR